MTPLELIEGARNLIEANPDGVGLVDRCSLWPYSKTEGGNQGDTFSYPSASRSGIPTLRESTGGNFQYVVGGETHIASHRLFMIRSTEALAIKPTHKIKLEPRDDVGELTFQRPAIVGNSFDPLVVVAAQLVQQGHA